MTQPAYIALGSNLNAPITQIQRAFRAIDSLAGCALTACSSLWRSAAIGPGSQPDYVNAALRIDTQLPALVLLDALQSIERDQGRVRSLRWGPRTLDLDLLLYGDAQLSCPRLCVPHPRLAERNFVIFPLLEIAPDLILPDGQPLAGLAQTTTSMGLQCIEDASTGRQA